MARGADEDRFRPRPGRARAGGTPPRRFTSQVLQAAQKAGVGVASRLGRKPGRGGINGRGRVAARMLEGRLGAKSRRVVVKARLVVLARAAPGSAAAHLRYIRRDGVAPQGEPGQPYGPSADRADGEAFLERGRDDRHQFRFIVSPEDAQAVGAAFTRRLMGQVEADLGTRLDWIAVDHHDTDNPHTHLIVRGVDDQGRDLVIARDYIAHGFRLRASMLATELLGPQSERELAERMAREVEAERWTSLDRRLAEQARAGGVALDGDDRLLRGRLATLERLGLAQPVAGGWRLRGDFEPTLRAMGERGDILRALQRAFSEPRPLEILHADAAPRVGIGRIVAKGLADELSGRGYLVLDGLDGRGRYLALPAGAELADFPKGAVVEVRAGAAGPRAADRALAAAAEAGLYRPSRRLDQLRAEGGGPDPDAMVRAHVRRLEAMRRAGIAERLDTDLWRLPADFLDRAAAHDAGRFGALRVEVLAVEPPERLARAIGATWLDRALIAGLRPAASGFGAEAQAALDIRRDFLVGQGLATRRGPSVRLDRDLLATLRRRELAGVGARIAAESGLAHREPAPGDTVRGTYRRSLTLVSGRFAMIDDGLGFSLVPWRPVLARRLGQAVEGAIGRGGGVDWTFGRSRGLNL
ncbi:MAG: DUF3363 domain-containing protein [Phenylobacterium sp.]|uniref:DUF3363 domain-containing protein n=1 Tax=Phenylobacterium sp. TaxID=1871053 RepID=UPI002735B835|nr:DUF3363 domain-containing protein [Phenylobacterium sp.]MDP3746658.1 DUF3363 domain-containing protein [Phenylobacterium sp.]